MPDAFLRPEWDDVRIKRWASEVGPDCSAAIARMSDDVKLKERAHNPALSILRLSKKRGDDRLEAACGHALPRLSHPRHRHLDEAMLDSEIDRDGGSGGGGGESRAAAAGGGRLRGADCRTG